MKREAYWSTQYVTFQQGGERSNNRRLVVNPYNIPYQLSQVIEQSVESSKVNEIKSQSRKRHSLYADSVYLLSSMASSSGTSNLEVKSWGAFCAFEPLRLRNVSNPATSSSSSPSFPLQESQQMSWMKACIPESNIPIALAGTLLLGIIGIGIDKATLAKVLGENLGLCGALAVGSLVSVGSFEGLQAGMLALAVGSSAVGWRVIVLVCASHDGYGVSFGVFVKTDDDDVWQSAEAGEGFYMQGRWRDWVEGAGHRQPRLSGRVTMAGSGILGSAIFRGALACGVPVSSCWMEISACGAAKLEAPLPSMCDIVARHSTEFHCFPCYRQRSENQQLYS